MTMSDLTGFDLRLCPLESPDFCSDSPRRVGGVSVKHPTIRDIRGGRFLLPGQLAGC